MLFPSTCDVIRNLSGMWQLLFPDQYVRYLDLPHQRNAELGGAFWERELRTLLHDLGEFLFPEKVFFNLGLILKI